MFAETNEKLTEDMKKLQLECLEKQQQLEEASTRLSFFSRVSEQLRVESCCRAASLTRLTITLANTSSKTRTAWNGIRPALKFFILLLQPELVEA